MARVRSTGTSLISSRRTSSLARSRIARPASRPSGSGSRRPRTACEARRTARTCASASRLIGEFRKILAQSSVEALEPDLIILDEFQRFRHLLEDPTGEDDTRTLAQTLFNYESEDGHARTLLLSATPYKMYTLAAESGHDDHYQDFVKTTEFLLGAETKALPRGAARVPRGDRRSRPRLAGHPRRAASARSSGA